MAIDRVIEDKRRLFWLLQLGGWGGWAATFYLGVLVYGDPPQQYYLYLPLIACIGMLLSLLLRWNTPSIEFYEAFGAEALDEWVGYRLEGETLKRFAAGG